MLILDTTQMPNARGGYWFAGKLTPAATTDGGTVEILCNKDLTRYIVSFFSLADSSSEGLSFTKTYTYSAETRTFTIKVVLRDSLGELATGITDYFIYVSTTELISLDDYNNGGLDLIEENLLNPKV